MAPGAQKPLIENDDEKLSFEEIAHSWEFQRENEKAENSKNAKAKAESNILYKGFHVEDWVSTMGTWQLIDGAYTAAGKGERRTFLQALVPDDFKLILEMTLFTGEGFGIWFRTDPQHLSGYSFQYARASRRTARARSCALFTKVTVASARTAMPLIAPVVPSTPLGTSTATTGSPLAFTASISAAKSP